MDLASMVDSALPQGALLLVTGASGFLASHIIQVALGSGFRVRGTVRSEEKARETIGLFASSGFSAMIIPDMVEEGAFDEAVKGVDAIIHSASVTSFSPDPKKVISPAIAGTTRLLHAAMWEPSIKRFVYTSSATAITFPNARTPEVITAEHWNDEAVRLAWQTENDSAGKAFQVYSASKVEAEKAVWAFVQEQKPSFAINCVNPATSFGRILGPAGESGNWIPNLLRSGRVPVDIPPQHMVDVADSARIHLAAVVDSTVSNQRILAFAHTFNWNDIIDGIKKAKPDAALPPHVQGLGHDAREVDNRLGEALMKKWWSQDGYKSLDETVYDNLEGFKV